MRIRRYRVWCLDGAGGASWRGGNSDGFVALMLTGVRQLSIICRREFADRVEHRSPSPPAAWRSGKSEAARPSECPHGSGRAGMVLGWSRTCAIRCGNRAAVRDGTASIPAGGPQHVRPFAFHSGGLDQFAAQLLISASFACAAVSLLRCLVGFVQLPCSSGWLGHSYVLVQARCKR